MIALLAAALQPGCQNAMVLAGLREAPPPVTDSAYFNTQVEQLLDRLNANKSRSIRRAAILDFVNTDGKVSELGGMLTTKFGERAVARNLFKVVPRGQVQEALAKLKINYTGQLKREEVTLIGEELGVDAVITGILYDLQKGSDIDLTVNAIQSSSGDLISAASVNIYRSKQVQTLIQQI